MQIEAMPDAGLIGCYILVCGVLFLIHVYFKALIRSPWVLFSFLRPLSSSCYTVCMLSDAFLVQPFKVASTGNF